MTIEKSKTYDATDVENIFFKPTFCGKAASDFGFKVIYNMPLPTKIPTFRHSNEILRSYSGGWHGGSATEFEERDIQLYKLKAESAYSADNYTATIYDILLNTYNVSSGDLTGSALEMAETELFRHALADDIYATTWFGDRNGNMSNFTGFDGFLKQCVLAKEDNSGLSLSIHDELLEMSSMDLFRAAWKEASDELRALAPDNQLAYFVSSDIYDAYQFYLDDLCTTSSYADATNGRPTMCYHGIPILEVPASKYNIQMCNSFCILTDRRNLILALNTADSPEKEIHMWYNPDEMENRQRIVFLAGTAIADPYLLSGHLCNGGLKM